MAKEIAQLLQLQGIDQRLTEASERIKRLQREQARLEEKAAEADQTYARQKEDLKQLEHKSLQRNLEVDELDANIRGYQHRLDTGIISFKEMEDLQAKIVSERKHIGEMEDEALQMMETISRQRSELVEAEKALAVRHEELRALVADMARQVQAEDAAIHRLQDERIELVQSMSEFLVSQYESLHKKFPDPIACVDHATCSGCKLKLSGSTIERARGSLSIVACEHCTRILYVE